MQGREFEAILASIKSHVPPYGLSILENIASADWDSVITEKDLGTCAEIILRVTADAILTADMTGKTRKMRAEALTRIAHRVEASSLPARDDNLRMYLRKLETRIAELE